jgi:hypothetical protein
MLKAINSLGQLVSVIVDKFTGFLISISGDHAYIHDGIGFSVFSFISSLASSGTYKVHIKTPATKYLHLRPTKLSTSGDKVSYLFYEDSSDTTAGTTFVPINKNRNSDNTSGATFLLNATVTSNGTLIDYDYIGGGTGVGGSRNGDAGNGSNEEILLKPNTNYTVVITNSSSAVNNILFKMFYYEEGKG